MKAQNPIEKVKIFVASGSDLKKEREKTILLLNKLNKSFPHLHLEPVEWETDLPPGSYNKERIQDEINPLLDDCDIVLALFYKKLGQFTVEEFHVALKKKKKVFLYFKTGFSPKSKIEHTQYGDVLDLKEKVETENKLLYKEYKTLKSFQTILYEDLNLYLSQTYPKEEKKTVSSVSSVRDQLISGSRLYYDALRGENGRFRFLNISEIILPHASGSSHPHSGKHLQDWHSITTSIPALWKNKIRHTVIVGEGGMGKTVSLIHLWEKLLNDAVGDRHAGFPLTAEWAPIPIPVFIALNELNQVSESNRDGFILETIRKNYGQDEVGTDEIEAFIKTPLKQGKKFIPSMLLLLDGFNEITVEKRELLIELNRLTEQYPGIQVVMTSRSDMRGNFNWAHWNLVQLKLIIKKKITEYLKKRNMPVPGQGRLLLLLGNPMMLTLYAASCEIQTRLSGSEHCCFKEKVETPGELLWNFMEAQVGNLRDKLGHDQPLIIKYTFLLKFVLPALGFEMEKARLFDFKVDQMDACIDRICRHLGQPGFLDTFTQFDEHIDALPLGECTNPIDRKKRTGELKKILTDELHMVVKEDGSFRFLHQNFRDFFAAVHILNEMEIGIKKNEIPVVLKERVLDYFVRGYMGEIEGEHYAKPYIDEKEKTWHIDINKENRLYHVLELCRDRFGEAVRYAVWNIVETWKEVREELTGADLTRLDLTSVQLNGVRGSRNYNEKYLAAVFDGSRVHEKGVLPQGHTGVVTSAAYSPDGRLFLSASWDHTIKEWDVATGTCVKTLAGHTGWVTSVVYSPDGSRFLSASWDGTIKEWNTATGACVKALAGHTGRVQNAVYSADGSKVLSVSWDNTIKEWDAAMGVFAKTLGGHTGWVNSAVYSVDGSRILSGSNDKTIKEWDAATGECVKTLAGHTGSVFSVVYSPDRSRILSASNDKTIKEWDAVSGQCVRTLAGHTDGVNSAVYSPDGSRILSGSNDNTIKEWDAATGQCMKTLAGHTGVVTSAVYSPDGSRVLSASGDTTIKEWDAATGQCVKTLAGHTKWVRSTVYSAYGCRVLSASLDHTIKEWDAATGQCVKILAGHTGTVWSAFYISYGSRVLSISYDCTIKEWDAATGQCLRTFKKEYPNIPWHLYKTIDIVLITNDNKIFEMDPSGELLHELTNIPGLFIQGCSFKNLEKGSQWTEEGLKILKQYGAILD